MMERIADGVGSYRRNVWIVGAVANGDSGM